MTDAHLGAVRTAIAAAEERHDPEYLQCLREVLAFLEPHVTPAKLAPGKYDWETFKRLATEKLGDD